VTIRGMHFLRFLAQHNVLNDGRSTTNNPFLETGRGRNIRKSEIGGTERVKRGEKEKQVKTYIYRAI